MSRERTNPYLDVWDHPSPAAGEHLDMMCVGEPADPPRSICALGNEMMGPGVDPVHRPGGQRKRRAATSERAQ